MIVTITSPEAIKATVTCGKPDIIEVVQAMSVNVVLSVFRDGLSAYQIALKYGFIGTEEEWNNQNQNPTIDGGLIF
ncbi:hypothetical protein [Flavobacterium sp. N1994]|uniref:hypothetical protein n=1 Tax=Flavobacterium sp. N1994 TaxID=2986827 RepID=UPI00222300B7|nr:hypothetical protein [Flavobacterium sp. N1994]